MSGVIRWENPPERGHGTSSHVVAHELIVRDLRREPGRWAVIHEQRSLSGMAALINRGRIRAYSPAGAFEAVTRLIGDVHTVYARYVGGDR